MLGPSWVNSNASLKKNPHIAEIPSEAHSVKLISRSTYQVQFFPYQTLQQQNCGHYIEPTLEEDWTDHSAVVSPQKAGMVIVFC